MSNVPKLRFKEFTDEWESKELGNLLEFKNGINAPKESYGKGIKFINVLDILNNDYITYENIIGKVDIDNDTFEKYCVKYGDVLFQRSSENREEVGTANVYLDNSNDAVFGGFVIRGKKIGKYNPIFMNKLLKTPLARKEIMIKSGGSTRFNVSQEILSNVDVILPSLQEQEKIGSFLSLIDKKISLQTEKVKALKDYKKGLMQKIFSRELRFKDENGNEFPKWEEKRLKDIFSFQYGQFNNNPDNGGKYPIYGANGIIGGYHKYNAENSIIIGHMGAYAGSVIWEDKKHFVTYNGTITKSKNEEKLISKFGYYLLVSKNIKKICSGSGQPFLSYDDLNNIKALCPRDIAEQKYISDFLSGLDVKLEKEQKTLDLLNDYKKGLLQQMFV